MYTKVRGQTPSKYIPMYMTSLGEGRPHCLEELAEGHWSRDSVMRSQLGAQGEKLNQQKPSVKSWRWECSCGCWEAEGVVGKFQTPKHRED